MKRNVCCLGAILSALAGLMLIAGIAHAHEKPEFAAGEQGAESLDGRALDVVAKDRHVPTPPRPGRSWNLEQIGFHDLGGRHGMNADVWAHGHYAYVGSFAFRGSCPVNGIDTGTKVIDISDPANPVQVNTLPTVPRTRVLDVKVTHIETAFFQGDLLAVSNEDCRVRGARGIELWDVTDPPNAELLGSFGPRRVWPGTFFEWGYGIHNVYLYQRGGRAFVLAAVSEAEIVQTENDLPTTGELKIIEVTNPRAPLEIANWGLKQDLGEPVGQIRDHKLIGDDCRPVCRLGNANIMLHDVWTNPQGTVAYLSYWDAGVILLDISDSSQPRYLGRGTYDLSDHGNTHSAVPAQGGNLVITGDEVDQQDSHGFMRVFDTTDMRDPVEIGRFRTENSVEPPPDSRSYSIHNLFVRGATVYAAWKSDGIRLLDISAPAAPREIGFFVPPAEADPNGNFRQNSVWGVYVQRDLIFASFQSGLFILKQRRMRISPGGADNRVQLGNGQRAAVAILGSERFDVTQLDVQSLAFGPHGARPIAEAQTSDQSPNVEDVNGDGFEDLLVQFEVTETGISLGDVEACLMGETFAGVPFSECDAMEVAEPSGGRPRR